MAMTSTELAAGPGWRAIDVICSSGPEDPPFEERHGAVCIAAVGAGTFQYRGSNGAAVLVPGSLLLGNPGTCFECGHEHGRGDRCTAFHLAPDFVERVVAAVPGVRRLSFDAPRLPPLAPLARLLAEAEVARDDVIHDGVDEAAMEEIALRLTGAVATLLCGSGRASPRVTSRDARRVSEALRRIDSETDGNVTLDGLADAAATSPYHFLRVFRDLVGMTPHQYVLRTRMHRAAVRLRRSDDPVTAIALDAGFNDLSTFNRRFRRVMGESPSAYRAAR